MSSDPFLVGHVGVWRTATEEWGTEDWNEDVSISGRVCVYINGDPNNISQG